MQFNLNEVILFGVVNSYFKHQLWSPRKLNSFLDLNILKIVAIIGYHSKDDTKN